MSRRVIDERARLRDAILAWIGDPASDDFDRLATWLVDYQARALPEYGRLCAARGGVPDHWLQAPLVPTDLFRDLDLCSLPGEQARFRTSGTTGQGARGFRRVPDLSLYDAAMTVPFVRRVLDGDPRPRPWLSLIPSAVRLPDSSLSHMTSALAANLATETCWAMQRDGLDLTAIDAFLAEHDEPLVVMTTSFALVHWLDTLDGPRSLPPGTRVMTTGGFKGRSRTISEDALLGAIEAQLGVPPSAVVPEYGMTELSSQAYGRPLVPNPPLRLRVVDPLTLAPVEPGVLGLVACFDLLNLDNVAAILTGDQGALDSDGRVTLHGRALQTVPRGCSLTAEELLSRADPASAVRPRPASRVPPRAPDALPPVVASPSMRQDAALPLLALADLDRGPGLALLRATVAMGFSEAVARDGLRAELDAWLAPGALDAARDAISRTPPFDAGPVSVLVIAARTLPASALRQVLLARLAGARVFLKPARGQEALARILAAADPDVTPALFDSTDIARRDAAIARAGAVIVLGADDTVADVRAATPIGTAFAGHGHAVSAAWLSRSPDPAALAGLARDLCAWDQSGCLSPQVVWCEGDPASLLGPLAAAVRDAEGVLPMRLPREAAHARHVEHARADMLGATAVTGTAVLAALGDPAFRATPGARFLWLLPASEAALLAVAPILKALARDGAPPELPAHVRTCAPGELQRPPLAADLSR